ncbi:ATP-dependent DNA helicase RecG [Patescibacteria group bacterium]
MNSINLDTKAQYIRGVGPTIAKKLAKIGINTARDLLLYLPYKYNDLSKVVPISSLKPLDSAIIKAKIVSIHASRSYRRRIHITTILLSDSSGSIEAVFFNQPYLERILKIRDELLVIGKSDFSHSRGLKMIFQVKGYEKLEGRQEFIPEIVPVYSERSGLYSKWFRARIRMVLALTEKLIDPIPEEIKDHADLINLDEAIKQLHHPESIEAVKVAKRRIAFDELFFIALTGLMQKKALKAEKGQSLELKNKEIKDFISSLDFKFTSDQDKSLKEILNDLSKFSPMNRLLQGDVGSGKTIVAAVAILNTIENNFCSAIIAPTEILAFQHFQTLTKIFKKYNYKIGLLTNAYVYIYEKGKLREIKKPEMYELLANKEINLIIGTHAIIQDKVKLPNLCLVIVDEQHRFGVEQRATLKKKTKISPHLLSMTATPIPRTLSLALYGDLDISQIRTMPKGRLPIKTKVVPPDKRQAAYDFIQKHIDRGRQVFVICPLIDESDKLGFKSVKQEFEKLDKDIFPHLKIGLLHGKLKPEEKQKVMANFKDNKVKILVSTSVVEVGVDIPNANIMMIEGADRFGLSQLHQFRGRVGRDKYQSFCLLFSESAGETALRRLQAMEDTSDGFKLSEVDLEIRGPGEVYGTRQHGMPDLKFASLLDYKLVKEVRDAANSIIEKIEDYPELIKKIKEFRSSKHME